MVDQLVETLKNDVEQAIEVPKIFLLDCTTACRTWCATACGTVGGYASSGVDRADTRQRRGGLHLVPHRCVWAAMGSSGGSWVLNTTSGITASPGRYINTGQGWCFYEPLYLAVTYLTPCLPGECLRGLFWEMTSGGISY